MAPETPDSRDLEGIDRSLNVAVLVLKKTTPSPSSTPHYITKGEVHDKYSYLAIAICNRVESSNPPAHRTAPSLCVPFSTASPSDREEAAAAVAARMSRNNGKGSKLECLRLSLSRARGVGPSATTRPGGDRGGNTSPRRLSSSSSSTASPPSSCVSSEGSPDAGAGGAGTPMVLAGCPRCMMYVMLSREDPRCPRCHSAVLLDFNDDEQGRQRQRR